jgi:hypothetical protein
MEEDGAANVPRVEVPIALYKGFVFVLVNFARSNSDADPLPPQSVPCIPICTDRNIVVLEHGWRPAWWRRDRGP